MGIRIDSDNPNFWVKQTVGFKCFKFTVMEFYKIRLEIVIFNVLMVVVLPDPFRGMGARRNSAEFLSNSAE